MIECNHARQRVIKMTRLTGRLSEWSKVSVCEDCGLVIVTGSKEGVAYETSFHIVDPVLLDTMRSWSNYVLKAD